MRFITSQKIALFHVMAVAASLVATTPALATVKYTFDLGQGSGFTVVAPEFLSQEAANTFGEYNFDLNVIEPYGKMASCIGYAGAPCDTQSILPTGLSFSPRPTDVVIEYRAASVGTIIRYFAGTALAATGVYQDAVLVD
ncbi:hypothetical protein KZX46_01885 (plasmid) [Polymorphobacter sp. PAMC 29334]|uniref:hypothetical protein n=1 Tax=Polymorphobacter sp. PAMC 29334 TaxID=2862331 RepID=UPI001C749EC0|nr:hypothetical protein [Polymorphobacter sp. PAMC 29334]QYE33538.1 hypothetical protein KZX46_01885 [Polymorphobacter sp. PAMC 29334]